ncbi:MAG TPA: hypothetical protein PKE12_08310 [Kiritimatiellia bacterium]|nr:hypothetical protein [Kiritimatiellia bacterium]
MRDARNLAHPVSRIAHRASRLRRRLGLSLVEVLMALVILGTGLTMLIAAASRCIAVVRKVRSLETTRELFGRVELEKPIWVEEEIEDAAGQGSFSGEYSQYRWRREVAEVGEEEDGLWLVTTTISWSERGKENSETVVTYVHWPKKN